MSFVRFLDFFNASHWPGDKRSSLVGNALGLMQELDKLDLRALIGPDLKRVERHQKQFEDSMVLSSPFDPSRYPDHDESSASVVVIEDQHGKEVAICAGRLFWVEGTLTESLHDEILPGSIVGAPSGDKISACSIAWSGACHVTQGQPKEVFPLMSRLLHLDLFNRWKWSHRLGIAKESVARAYGNKTYGFPTIQQAIWRGDKEDWLMLADRSIDANRMVISEYSNVSCPLGVPPLTGVKNGR